MPHSPAPARWMPRSEKKTAGCTEVDLTPSPTASDRSRSGSRSPASDRRRSPSSRRRCTRSRTPAPRRRQRRGHRHAKSGGRGRRQRRARRSSSSSPAASRSGSKASSAAKESQPSFRTFVLQSLPDNVGPKEAAAAFEKHLRELDEKAAEAWRGTGLLFDMYHPISALRRFDLRVRVAHRSAGAFLEDVREGRYSGLCLRAPDAEDGDGSRMSCRTAGHMLPPQFAFDPDMNSIRAGGIPGKASVWDHYNALAPCPGFVTASWPRCSGPDAEREVRARFSSGLMVRQAIAALGALNVKVEKIEPSAELNALVVPPEMSHPERLRKDEELASKAVRLLDGLAGVRPEVTAGILATEGSTEARLDLLVTYLRRVHHFCFYAAEWCEDEWDLQARCSSAVVRDGTGVALEGAWALEHEERLRRFFAAPGGQRPCVPSRDEEPIASMVAHLEKELIVQAAPNKFKCVVCSKHFKGPEYVQKHLRKVHTDRLEAVRQKVLDEQAMEACVEDMRRQRGDL